MLKWLQRGSKRLQRAARPGAAAVVVGLLGAAIAAPAVAQGAGPTPGAPASRLNDIVQRGTLRICTTGDYKPYTYLRSDGRFEGIDIALAESLAQSLQVKPEFVKTSWKALTDDFIAKCDIAVGGVSVTLDRQRRAFFTQAYMVDGKTPVVRCGDVDKYQTVADINRPAVRTIVNPGGTNERFARRYFGQSNLTVYPDNVTIFRQIAEGKADVMVTDASETLYQHKLDPRLCSVHPEKPFEFSEKAFMLPQGDVIYQQYVDQWLHLLKETGGFSAITDSWLK
ncbi:transporter substrate-binding domain-containing protein [Chitinasiproducens palmae]|uniref:Cyclohexadienyl dehydratase n=1 Tax=Chitinasiproducens palmae TaxID=1770053 RepID=A0A1H2PP70_9BURK|nr:transporter substrate-binding domain-containing protein [Chitinasiproducens palmae]SDV48533.1 cyclohexadienyl dehydratase [Chitinasiproducens palmae]